MIFLAVLAFVRGPESGPYTFGAIVLLMWAICLLTIAHGFAAPPPSVPTGAGLIARIKVRVRRAALWSMGALMTLLSGLVLFVTFRAAAMWIRGG